MKHFLIKVTYVTDPKTRNDSNILSTVDVTICVYEYCCPDNVDTEQTGHTGHWAEGDDVRLAEGCAEKLGTIIGINDDDEEAVVTLDGFGVDNDEVVGVMEREAVLDDDTEWLGDDDRDDVNDGF